MAPAACLCAVGAFRLSVSSDSDGWSSATSARRWTMFRGLQQLGLGLAMVLLAVATTRGEENLRDTEAGRQVLQTLKGLAQGNEHDAGIDTLTLDIWSGRVHGQVWVRHRQSWGTQRVWIPWPLPSHWEEREVVAYDLR